MVGFDDGNEQTKTLDGVFVSNINPDLTTSINITLAKQLQENRDICSRGNEKHGAFDISEELAQKMLQAVNRSGKSNSDVVRPYINGRDVVQRPSNTWIIDFFEMELEEAEQYEMPMEHVRKYVKPVRDKNNRDRRREKWWQHGEIIPKMRQAISHLKRFIVTPAVSKHRIFIWLEEGAVPDHQLHVIAREDDYFLGVLQSQIHEFWALPMGTSVGPTPRYTPKTTFETFPFPWPPGQEAVESEAYQAVAEAARCLHEERAAWLNPSPPPAPPHFVERGVKDLKERTLTNLYNALNVWRNPSPSPSPYTERGVKRGKITDAAGDFAPRLAELHEALDKAVCAAYGWPESVLGDEEEILRRLLALNGERARTEEKA